jgi:hypothetical protein
MVPQLAQVADDYSVPVYSSGRFDSVTEKYDFAREIGAAARLEITVGGPALFAPPAWAQPRPCGYPDGRVAEVFLQNQKPGCQSDSDARDTAVAANLALQHGCHVGGAPARAAVRLAEQAIDAIGRSARSDRRRRPLMSSAFARRRFEWLDRIARDERAPHLAFRLACVLSGYVNREGGYAWPGQETLAKEAQEHRRARALRLLRSRFGSGASP